MNRRRVHSQLGNFFFISFFFALLNTRLLRVCLRAHVAWPLKEGVWCPLTLQPRQFHTSERNVARASVCVHRWLTLCSWENSHFSSITLRFPSLDKDCPVLDERNILIARNQRKKARGETCSSRAKDWLPSIGCLASLSLSLSTETPESRAEL